MIETKDTAQRREVGFSRNLSKYLGANSEPLGFGGYTHIFWVKKSNKTSNNNIVYFIVCSHLEF